MWKQFDLLDEIILLGHRLFCSVVQKNKGSNSALSGHRIVACCSEAVGGCRRLLEPRGRFGLTQMSSQLRRDIQSLMVAKIRVFFKCVQILESLRIILAESSGSDLDILCRATLQPCIYRYQSFMRLGVLES